VSSAAWFAGVTRETCEEWAAELAVVTLDAVDPCLAIAVGTAPALPGHRVILTLIDVGARGGLHRRWHHAPVPVRGYGFDADADECARLNARRDGVTYLPYALGAKDGAQATLHLTASRGSSSLFEPNRSVLDQFPYGKAITVERTVPLTLTTLDTACSRHELQPDVIKLDVQGAELDVLRGAERVLPEALLVEAEVEFQPLYVEQPLFRHFDAFMAEKGWILLGLRRDYWRRSAAPTADGGTLTHADALYVNPARIAATTAAEPVLGALAAYRQADYVCALAQRIGRQDLIARLLPEKPWVNRMVGRALGRLTSHRFVRAWVDHCRQPDATDWHDPETFF
jgi:FkbM family methyltransferase